MLDAQTGGQGRCSLKTCTGLINPWSCAYIFHKRRSLGVGNANGITLSISGCQKELSTLRRWQCCSDIGSLEDEPSEIFLIVVGVRIGVRIIFQIVVVLFLKIRIHARDPLFQTVIVHHGVVVKFVIILVIPRVTRICCLSLSPLRLPLPMPFFENLLLIGGTNHIETETG